MVPVIASRAAGLSSPAACTESRHLQMIPAAVQLRLSRRRCGQQESGAVSESRFPNKRDM